MLLIISVLWLSTLMLLLTDIEILFCSSCIRYVLALAFILLLDIVYSRGRMFAAIPFVLRNT